jgi:tRNA nucleotidyltransferase (CCA-adding enzyme)
VECRALAALTARYRSQIDRTAELGAAPLLDLLLGVDALRRPARLEQLLKACAALWAARHGRTGSRYPPAALIWSALAAVKQVNAAAIAAGREGRGNLPQRLRAQRLTALGDWRRSTRRR